MKDLKTLIATLILIVLCNIGFAQSITDIKEYISLQIDTYTPLRSYDNYALFTDDIVKLHTKIFTGKELSEDVYNNIFIYGIEAHRGEGLSGDIWLEEAQTIDLRGVTKISTIRYPDKNRYTYRIILHLEPGYLRTKYTHAFSNEAEITYLDKLQILISDDSEIAKKIKMAFMDLGRKMGIDIKDGDLY